MQPVPSERSRDDGRFEVREILGAGGMGVVYRALDRRLGRVVALKALRQASGRDLYRFKREFRSLADIAHPNLVALHELHTSGDEWFFTMEAVDGVSFIDWVRPSLATPLPPVGPDQPPRPRVRHDVVSSPVDLDRLRSALPQLVDGVLALHLCGKLHRDLKPSNVMVRPDGQVVLLDFGLVSDLEDIHAERTHEQAAVGTPAHMSPEQAADQPLTEASDWYSVGVMLYEALTGWRPFEGSPHEVMRRKQTELPTAPRHVDPGVPADLDELCMQMLARHPRQRPDGRAILAALGTVPSAATAELERAMASTPFVGRADELALLEQARVDAETRGVAVFVRGDSGMGKSALVRAFLDATAQRTDGAPRPPVILEGRCYERESVPFKSLDAIIDAMTGVLLRLPEERLAEIVPRDASALVRLFPVLRRVSAVAGNALGTVPPDPQELRRRAFRALRHLFGRLARLQPLILVIDDLQWGDTDSAIFLAELIHHPEPLPILLVLVHRTEDDAGIVARVREPAPGLPAGDVRPIDLGPLPEGDARAMVRAIGDAGESTAELVIREAGGHPLFLYELARSSEARREPATLGELIRRRVRELPVAAAQLLRTCAIAGRPTPAGRLAAAVGADAVGAELLRLRGERLIRVRQLGSDDAAVEPYHDRIRAAVVATMSRREQQNVHAALAETYERDDDSGDLEALVEHCLGAGQRARAAVHAVRAAEAAEHVFAFHRAAELYRLAVEHSDATPEERRILVRRLGHALANAGSSEDAAAAFAEAEIGATPDEVFELQRLRLEQMLRRGKLAEGLDLCRKVLAPVGEHLPSSRRSAVRVAVWERMRVRLRGLGFTPRPPSAIDPQVLRHADVLFSTSAAIGFVDPIIGKALQFKFLRASLDAGDVERIGQAMSQEVGYLASAGVATRQRVDKVIERLRELVGPMGESYIAGRARAAEGLASFLTGRWKDARISFEAGTRMMRDHGTSGRFELDVAELFHLATLFYLGETREMVRRAPLLLREAVERGDVYAQHGLRGWRSNVVWLVMGKPEDARAHALGVAAESMAPDGFHLHHYYELLAHGQIDLYLGDAEGAWQRIEAAWPVLTGSYLTRIQTVRVESAFLRARAAVGHAAGLRAAKRAPLLAEARRLARQLEKEGAGWADAFGQHVRAGIAQVEGDREGALLALDGAQRTYAACDMQLYAAAAQHRRGQLETGAVAQSLLTAARTAMAGQAVADPAGMTRMLSGLDA
jgi:tRNA A-37 threonylcarbamoyl transferase component Bud32